MCHNTLLSKNSVTMHFLIFYAVAMHCLTCKASKCIDNHAMCHNTLLGMRCVKRLCLARDASELMLARDDSQGIAWHYVLYGFSQHGYLCLAGKAFKQYTRKIKIKM